MEYLNFCLWQLGYGHGRNSVTEMPLSTALPQRWSISGGRRISLRVWGQALVFVTQLLLFNFEQFGTFSFLSDRSYDLSGELDFNTVCYHAN